MSQKKKLEFYKNLYYINFYIIVYNKLKINIINIILYFECLNKIS
jgi:hypothetical protein